MPTFFYETVRKALQNKGLRVFLVAVRARLRILPATWALPIRPIRFGRDFAQLEKCSGVRLPVWAEGATVIMQSFHTK